MELDQKKWVEGLSACVADALAEFRTTIKDKIAIFALDCHPWNGVLTLAILTTRELAEAPSLESIAEMAAWRFYDFCAGSKSWKSNIPLLSAQMRQSYELAMNDRVT